MWRIVAFSQNVLDRLSETFMSGKYYSYFNVWNDIGNLLHINALPLLERYQLKMANNRHQSAWDKHVHEPVSKALTIRKVLEKYEE